MTRKHTTTRQGRRAIVVNSRWGIHFARSARALVAVGILGALPVEACGGDDESGQHYPPSTAGVAGDGASATGGATITGGRSATGGVSVAGGTSGASGAAAVTGGFGVAGAAGSGSDSGGVAGGGGRATSDLGGTGGADGAGADGGEAGEAGEAGGSAGAGEQQSTSGGAGGSPDEPGGAAGAAGASADSGGMPGGGGIAGAAGSLCVPAGGAGFGGSGTLVERTDWVQVDDGCYGYIIENAAMYSSSQTVNYDGTSFGIASATEGERDPTGSVRSYAAFFIGRNSGRDSLASGLPRIAGTVQSIAGEMATNAGTISGVHAARFELDFRSPAGYVQVVFHPNAHWIPDGIQVEDITVAGETFTVWTADGSYPMATYVIETPTPNLAIDLEPFLADAIARDVIVPDAELYLAGGFLDMWSDCVGLAVDRFALTID